LISFPRDVSMSNIQRKSQHPDRMLDSLTTSRQHPVSMQQPECQQNVWKMAFVTRHKRQDRRIGEDQ